MKINIIRLLDAIGKIFADFPFVCLSRKHCYGGSFTTCIQKLMLHMEYVFFRRKIKFLSLFNSKLFINVQFFPTLTKTTHYIQILGFMIFRKNNVWIFLYESSNKILVDFVLTCESYVNLFRQYEFKKIFQ